MNLDIPDNFSLCQNRDCPQASQCLRFLAYQHCPQDKPFISTVNPACYPKGGEPCPIFRSNEPVQLVWGVQKIFDQIPHATAKQVKAQVIAVLGRTLYYRAYREEYPLSPSIRRPSSGYLPSMA